MYQYPTVSGTTELLERSIKLWFTTKYTKTLQVNWKRYRLGNYFLALTYLKISRQKQAHKIEILENV